MHGSSRKGFVFIAVHPGKDEVVIKRLKNLPECQEIHTITGEHDLLAIVKVKRGMLTDSTGTIVDLVKKKIRTIPGVDDTETVISQECFYHEDDDDSEADLDDTL